MGQEGEESRDRDINSPDISEVGRQNTTCIGLSCHHGHFPHHPFIYPFYKTVSPGCVPAAVPALLATCCRIERAAPAFSAFPSCHHHMPPFPSHPLPLGDSSHTPTHPLALPLLFSLSLPPILLLHTLHLGTEKEEIYARHLP